ncbi:MAG: type 4a pilus biogenesis protein PilO [Zoogloeaceae bacterium]|jgi:type IV pilus assembly protein PilO|nr:type 4a pilus biogenesis protein PilO [Zoogloeaceae bacterium]
MSGKKTSGLSWQQIQEDFKCLSNSDPGTWLPIPRMFVLLAIVVAVAVLGGYLVWTPQGEEIDAAKAKEEQLKTEVLDSKRAAASVNLYKQQLEELDRSFGSLLKQLPNRAEVETLLVEVNQAGLGRGLQFNLFKPGAEIKHDFYAELPIDVEVSGSYHDIGAFAADIASLPRIVTLNDIDLAAARDGGAALTMRMKVKTFRYMDEGK